MSKPIKTRVLEILKEQDPLTSIFTLLIELGDHKDAGVVRDVALRILETQHDWQGIRQCLRLWPTMLIWANEFLQRMYRRIGDVSVVQPFTSPTQLDRQIERVSSIYWKSGNKPESKSATNKAFRDFLTLTKQTETLQSLSPYPHFGELKLPNLPLPPKQDRTVGNNPFNPKNPDYVIEQQIRRNAFAEGGFRQLEEPSVAPNTGWKFPELPKMETIPKSEYNTPFSEQKSLFDNRRHSTSKFNVQRTFKEATPNKISDNELSFAFSPINHKPDIHRAKQTRTKWTPTSNNPFTKIEEAIDDSFSENLESLSRPVIKRETYTTDVNQLYPHESVLLLTRNNFFSSRSKTSVLDSVRQSMPNSILGSIIKEMEQRVK